MNCLLPRKLIVENVLNTCFNNDKYQCFVKAHQQEASALLLHLNYVDLAKPLSARIEPLVERRAPFQIHHQLPYQWHALGVENRQQISVVYILAIIYVPLSTAYIDNKTSREFPKLVAYTYPHVRYYLFVKQRNYVFSIRKFWKQHFKEIVLKLLTPLM